MIRVRVTSDMPPGIRIIEIRPEDELARDPRYQLRAAGNRRRTTAEDRGSGFNACYEANDSLRVLALGAAARGVN